MEENIELPETQTPIEFLSTISKREPQFRIEDYTELIAKVARINGDTSVLDLEDAIAIATMSFYRASILFDPNRGVKFETYAIAAMKMDIWKQKARIRKEKENEVALDERKHSSVADTTSKREMERIRMRAMLERHLNSLPERERKIVELSYGIDCDAKSFREIAVLMNLSFPRIQQLRNRALLRLKQSLSVNA